MYEVVNEGKQPKKFNEYLFLPIEGPCKFMCTLTYMFPIFRFQSNIIINL